MKILLEDSQGIFAEFERQKSIVIKELEWAKALTTLPQKQDLVNKR